ncbi:MAG: tetratricopeptide repeat protein [Candidatus Lokiarchaeota archaeon]|nr:tetratricopeptide repeat protein [Candidatus Lokiarchaeota archaeon]
MFERLSNKLKKAINFYNQENYKESLRLYNKIIDLSSEIGFYEYKASALVGIAEVYKKLDDENKVFENYLAAYEIFQAIKEIRGYRLSSANIVEIYKRQGRYQEILEIYLQDLDFYQDLENEIETIKALNNIGETYQKLGDIEKAIAFYNQALSLCQELENQELKFKIVKNLESTKRLS